jgi:hypothetical protein
MNCAEWALLWAYTTTDAQALGDIGNLRFGSDFNTKLSCSHNGATSLALLSAFFWLALYFLLVGIAKVRKEHELNKVK